MLCTYATVTSLHGKTLDKQAVSPAERTLRAGGEKLQTWFGELETQQTDFPPNLHACSSLQRLMRLSEWASEVSLAALLASILPSLTVITAATWKERACLPFPGLGTPGVPLQLWAATWPQAGESVPGSAVEPEENRAEGWRGTGWLHEALSQLFMCSVPHEAWETRAKVFLGSTSI